MTLLTRLWLDALRSSRVMELVRVFLSLVLGLSVSYGFNMKVCRYVCGRGNARLGLVSLRLLKLTTLKLSACDA